MAYIQNILAIVLCACILQDAYAQNKPMKKSMSKKRTTAVAIPENSMSPKFGYSKKYPNLTLVQTNFWEAWDYINNKNQYGKLGTRSARNMFEHMVNNESLWEALVKTIKRYRKMTENEVKAQEHMKLSNILGELMTSPIAMEKNGLPKFTMAANDMYESLVYVESETCEDALLNAANIVESGVIDTFLNTTSNFLSTLEVRPLRMVDYVNKIKSLLNLGGLMQMGDVLSNSVLKLADAVAEDEPETPKLKRKLSRKASQKANR